MPKPKAKPDSKFSIRHLITNILLVFAVICFLFTIFFAILAKDSTEDIFILGYKPYIITSASMSPELSVHSVILIRQTPFDEIQVGDIISYRASNYNLPVCHRVIEITENGLITKGDNVNVPDQEVVTSDMFRGKLIWHTNFFAGYITFVQEKGIFIGLILPALLIFGLIFALYLVPKKVKQKESKNASSPEN